MRHGPPELRNPHTKDEEEIQVPPKSPIVVPPPNQVTWHSDVYSPGDFVPADLEDIPVQETPTTRPHGEILEAILAKLLREEMRPDLYTVAFRVNITGAGWTLLIPAQAGGALYVSAIWAHNSQAAIAGAFGQGNSPGDAEFFQSFQDAGSDLGLLNGTALISIVNRFPDWVFRCDPSKGFMVHMSGTCVFDGYIQYFVRELSEQKYE
jgi:hypothetical protein